jgi:hypothetical protein
MAKSDHAYGLAFDATFQSLAASLAQREIPLFRALAHSLCHASGGFHVEEYHGNAHQVDFQGDGKHSRPNALCELSDLLILVYSPTAQTARFTYLQAKSERGTVGNPNVHAFNANLEQWDLLSRKPTISGHGKFNPPGDLLSGAQLASIGSFGIFYRNRARGTEMAYASGDCLSPTAIHALRRGKVALQGASIIRKVHGLPERTFLTSNYEFARDLFGLRIGEPLLVRGTPSSTPGGRWMAEILRSQTIGHNGPDSNRPLLLELANSLGGGEIPPANSYFGAKRMILIGSDCDPLVDTGFEHTPEPSPEPDYEVIQQMTYMRQG